MAATRLIALHVNKGKTVAQCLADRTDYSQNAAKTNDGEFISSYECDPKTADEEFLLSKRQYQHITGRQQKNNIIAYQIRQSFKPGEITPEEANQVGYETAMRWTKGKHAFIVATHIDKSHMANNSTVTIHRSWQDCVQRLLVRGLIVVGAGDTEYDALYDLLACRFIIPIGAAWPLRVLLFLKLTFLEGISWKITRRLFHVDARSVCEKKVIRLARQTSLSCAEIIKCIEMGIRRLKDGYDVLDKLYDDNDLNCDNFAQAVREYHCSREVITAVVNLYLRQQIMIDTY